MRYLGALLGPGGIFQRDPNEIMKPVYVVQKAPLKLQQKIELLRLSILPTICNSLSLQTK